MRQSDVIAICNALVDLMTPARDEDLTRLQLTKGVMHLVSAEEQLAYLAELCHHDHTLELGGSSLNALRVMAGMGHKVGFVGTIGRDIYGTKITERMRQLEMNSFVHETEEATGTCLIAISPDGERTMITSLGASRLYHADHIPHQAIRDARILHFCGYQWDTDGQKDAIYQAMTTAKESKTLISFDVADPFVVERNQGDFQEVIAEYADIVFANRQEAVLLYGCDPEEAAARIAKDGAIAVMKLGGEGALIRHGHKVYRVPAVKTQVVDTTAAGDTFAGGFLSGFLHERDLMTCGHIAATVAADVISRVGTTVADDVLAKASAMH